MSTTPVNSDALVSTIRRHLDGRHAGVRDQVRELLTDPLMHPVHGLGVEEHRARVFDQATLLAKRGLGPMQGYPVIAGGTGEMGAGIAAFETLAFGDLSLVIKAGVQWGLFGGAVMQLGSEHHMKTYGDRITNFELPGCFAMTETGHGSDVQSLRTTATYNPADSTFVINTPDEDARKDYIGNAARDGRMAVVFAQLIVDGTEQGVHALMVGLRDENLELLPGVTISDDGHKAGLNGVDNGRITFDHVRVDRTALLDRFGTVDADGTYRSEIENKTRRFFTMLGTLVQGRTSIAGAAISASKVALTIAIRYGEVRRQFGGDDGGQENRLMDYQAHRRALLPSLAATYALHFAQADLVDRLAAAMDGGDAESRREVETLAAGLKVLATWHCADAIQTSREACGGAGYLSENRLPALRADTDVFATFEGANVVLLQLIAKGLLTGYSEEFSEMDMLDTVRFVTDKVLDNVVERLRAVPLLQSLRGASPTRQSNDDVRDRGWHCELLADREEHALETAAARIRSGMEDHGDAFQAFNAAQSHVLYAARVHVESMVLSQFNEAVDRCADPAAKQVLQLVASLHALRTIESDRGWFLEHGRLTPTTSKTITGVVDALCDELRPHALDLVAAFGIPEESIAAPIATGEEAARQALRARAT